MELKRDLSEGVFDVRVADDMDPRPLFEKYQFLTPGVFLRSPRPTFFQPVSL